MKGNESETLQDHLAGFAPDADEYDEEREAESKARIQKESKLSSWYQKFGLTTTVADLVDYCVKNHKPVDLAYEIRDCYASIIDVPYQTFKITAKAGWHSVKIFDELGSSNGPYADKTYARTIKKFLQKRIKVTSTLNGKNPTNYTKNKLHALEEKLKGNLDDQFYPVPHFW
ncbi:MAG: hypothetical protein NTY99_02555 [DPANN group archaeon]|nr:hypothetical protein [DPANN group archaeon]